MRQKIVKHGLLILIFLSVFILPFNPAHGQEMNPAQTMEKFGNAVVLIATVTNNEEIGQGSGFIVSKDGVIVTNYHVIENAYPAFVKLKNGDIYEDIGVIDFNERKDYAVIKIKGFDLPVVNIGNSNDVKVGEELVVIGNPKGLENTISNGLLSQIRDTGKGYKLQQISAPISHGSSGSPVFNSKGEVIGIASSGFSADYGQNLNFSLPINYIRAVIGNDVKYSLKVFTGLEKEESVIERVSKAKAVDNKKMLEIMNDSLSVLLTSVEKIPIFYNIMSESGEKGDLFIPNEFYSMKEALKNAGNKIYTVSSADKELEEMRIKIQNNIEETYNSLAGMMEVLTAKEVDVNKVRTLGMKAALSLQLEDDFLLKFVERIKRDAPELEKDVFFSLIYEFENKDNENSDEKKTNNGVMGCELYMYSDVPTCQDVVENSPADRAGIKVNDIIVGIKNGPSFSSWKEYYDFRKTTSPGDVYRFRINRDNKLLIKKIKLGKHRDYL